jgi:hypothetical protein
MAGTVSNPIFVKDGQYLSMTADNAITLGNAVRLTTTSTDTCDVGREASNHDTIIGVATGGDRFSRTSTDNVIAAGSKVTVCTRGIVNVYTGTSAIVRGSHLEAGASGVVELAGTSGYNPATASTKDIFAIALEPNGSAAATIKAKLLIG